MRPTLETARRLDYLTVRHGFQNVAQVATAHAALFASFYALQFIPFSLALLPALAACWVHQRFVSEWVHEAAHYNLVPDRKWNDILADWLLSCWHGYRIEGYRATHMRHHAAEEFFTAGDPDTERLGLRTRRQLYAALLRDVSGYTAFSTYFEIVFGAPKRSGEPLFFRLGAAAQYLLPVAFLHVSFLTLSYLSGLAHFYILYMACLVTIYTLLNRIRVYGQHLAVTDHGVAADHTRASRTIDAGLCDRIFITSALMLYHNEHHAKPALPYRALADVSQPSNDPNKYMDSRWPLLFRFLRSLPPQ